MHPCTFSTVVFNIVVMFCHWRSDQHPRLGSHGEESLTEAMALLQSTQNTLDELHKEVGPSSCFTSDIMCLVSIIISWYSLFLSVSSYSHIRQVQQLFCPRVRWKWPSQTCLSSWWLLDTSTTQTLKRTAKEPLRPSILALLCFSLYISSCTPVIR